MAAQHGVQIVPSGQPGPEPFGHPPTRTERRSSSGPPDDQRAFDLLQQAAATLLH
jgi:hypothetical protein